VSADLVHWQELPVALYPDELGTVFSGSAVVDRGNTGGFRNGQEHALVCIYTSAGEPFTQSIAYSNDRGRTWIKYQSNPILGHVAGHNRDPKVVWHEPTVRWVMALYLEGHRYALYASPDLKAWTQLCEIEVPGASECPDFFELAVDGETQDTRWVFWAANGTYLLGAFDGQTFTPQSEVLRLVWSEDSYAAQTWSGIPAEDGRRIQIAWARVNLPDMPFNQFMNCPCELTLRTTADGVRLFSEPVREMEVLRRDAWCCQDVSLCAGESLLAGIEGELLDISAELGIDQASEVGLLARGVPVRYDAKEEELVCEDRVAPLKSIDGRIRLRLLVDRASIEIFGNDGRVALPVGVILDDRERSLEVFCRGGPATLHTLEVHELRSAWGRRAARSA
jgi:sucrose-6-phosphate hydrolase SacC (GH32 family)